MAFQNHYPNLVSEQTQAHSRLIRNYDGPNSDFDFIIIGSGIGGGILADDLADRLGDQKRILLLDAGSFIYPTHVYNISRIPNGAVANHFGVASTRPWQDSRHFIGGEPQLAFGGRSIFWSGLIPEAQDWELDFFPDQVRTDLKADYLSKAATRMHASKTLGDKAKAVVTYFRNSSLAADFDIQETPRALHQPYLDDQGHPRDRFFEEPTGVFNTSELLINQLGLTPGRDQNGNGLFLRLNSFVEGITDIPHNWHEVRCTSTLNGEARSFYAPNVIVAAGSMESPKLINRSSVFQRLPQDIQSRVGFGLTDHPVSGESQAYVSAVGKSPANRIELGPKDHAKLIFYSKGLTDAQGNTRFPFNVEMNINHEYWHLRNNDPSAEAIPHDSTRTRVDIKFSFANLLDDANGILSHAQDGYRPGVRFKRFADLQDLLGNRFPRIAGWQKSPGDFLHLLNSTRDRIFHEFDQVQWLSAPYGYPPGGQWPFGWGTVHHACGTLRMPWKAHRNEAQFNRRSVVDENLQVHNSPGLYVCDMSVLPISCAANPVRQLGALALRLSEHLG